MKGQCIWLGVDGLKLHFQLYFPPSVPSRVVPARFAHLPSQYPYMLVCTFSIWEGNLKPFKSTSRVLSTLPVHHTQNSQGTLCSLSRNYLGGTQLRTCAHSNSPSNWSLVSLRTELTPPSWELKTLHKT